MRQHKQTASTTRRIVVLTTLLGNFNVQFGLWVVFLREQSVPLAAIGVLQAILGVSMFASEFPSGVFADRWGRKPLLVLGHLLVAVYLGAMYVDVPFPMLTVAFVALGVGVACISGAELALLLETIPDDAAPDAKTRWVGRYLAITTGSLAAGAVAGAYLQAISWHALFGAGLILEVGAAVLCTFLVDHKPRFATHMTMREQLRDLGLTVRAEPATRRFLLALGLFTGGASLVAFMAQNVLSSVGVDPGAISLLYGVAATCAIPSAMIAHIFQRRWGTKWPLTVSAILSVVASAVLGLPSGIAVGVGFVGVLLIDGIVDTIGQSTLATMAGGQHTASLLSGRNLVASVAIGVGGPTVGVIDLQCSPGVALLVVTAIYFGASALLFCWMIGPSPGIDPFLYSPLGEGVK